MAKGSADFLDMTPKAQATNRHIGFHLKVKNFRESKDTIKRRKCLLIISNFSTF